MKKRKTFLLAISVLGALLITACNANSISSQNNSGQFSEPTQQSQGSKPVNEKNDVSYEITYQNARTYTNSNGRTRVQTIVEITNTGDGNLYLSSCSYDLEDANGSLVASKSMASTYPSVLGPGEKGYVYEDTPLDNYNGEGELTVLPRPDVEAAKIDLVRYNVTDVSLSDSSFGGIKVLGRIENQTTQSEEGPIYIVAFFYDSEGTPIGSDFTILSEKFDVGSKMGFEMSSFPFPGDITVDMISETTVYAYPLQYQF